MTDQNRWRTYAHPSTAPGSYGCCQILDMRTRVIHLIDLDAYHYHRALMRPQAVSANTISAALWPTAGDKVRHALPMQLVHYLLQIRGAEMPAPGPDRQMFSFSVYQDGSHSWPAITLMTREVRRSTLV